MLLLFSFSLIACGAALGVVSVLRAHRWSETRQALAAALVSAMMLLGSLGAARVLGIL